MPAIYNIADHGRRRRVEIPAFCRDSFFDGAKKVSIEASEDADGKYIKIRPVREGV